MLSPVIFYSFRTDASRTLSDVVQMLLAKPPRTAPSSPNTRAGRVREAGASVHLPPSGEWPHIYKGTAEGRTPGRCRTLSYTPHEPVSLRPTPCPPSARPTMTGTRLLGATCSETAGTRAPRPGTGPECQGWGSEAGRGSGRVGHGLGASHGLQAAAAPALPATQHSRAPSASSLATSRPTLMSHSGQTRGLLAASPEEGLVGTAPPLAGAGHARLGHPQGCGERANSDKHLDTARALFRIR